ncbi:MAG: DUF1028 domain-containing protein [Gammaproteobacteria bacterium]|nr:DUF1028 domain-containing protein [Gammaproteobacteria bacterium]
MTFSIIAYDETTGTAGAATATGGVAVGAYVPHVRAGVGAIVTQGAYTNWLYGERGLALLATGENAESVLEKIVGEDQGREFRQCLVIDRNGHGAGWTGSENTGLKEFSTAPGVVAGGNFLASHGIADALIRSFLTYPDQPMAWRLFKALQAGEKSGGDVRGLISASIKVDFTDRPPVDLRVDYEPGQALARLETVYRHFHSPPFKEFYDGVPTRTNYSKCGPQS